MKLVNLLFFLASRRFYLTSNASSCEQHGFHCSTLHTVSLRPAADSAISREQGPVTAPVARNTHCSVRLTKVHSAPALPHPCPSCQRPLQYHSEKAGSREPALFASDPGQGAMECPFCGYKAQAGQHEDYAMQLVCCRRGQQSPLLPPPFL